ncbi:TonB-dependent receptor [Acidipila sp. EB88]|uniref:TonB-dependent receptor n=1 Tax=Acidipila sp. EB88 TaxID=2305226 RepID=UPI000F5EDF42|nr:TonB-dependent receptor [Acidipila sp. EB88]RRA48263.1 carboxypeptidase regulatory-like domain-containing protein [Acidipila sp. EB88]
MFNTPLRRTALAALVLPALASTALMAQTLNGINGTVTDASGAVISNCQVAVTNVATGVVTRTVSSSAGSYTIPSLVPGSYTVTFTAPGFQTSAHSGVTVETGRTSNVNGMLTTGETSTTIDVKSSAISLQTDTPQVGVTIENKVVQELPEQLNGQARQIDDFIFLAPGVTGSEFSKRISGGEDFQNEVLFQGVPAIQSETEGFQSYINPPFEMVNEFHVSSSVFSTQYGLGQGAVNYNFVGGTNKIHGDAFEINRNNYFDARGLVQINPTVPVDKQNNYGFSVGGPVLIPHVYDGRNRTFFHASSEWFKYNQQPAVTMTVPTAQAKQGNFAGYSPIYVPAGLNCAGLTAGQQFPNNVIPQSCISALSASLIPQIPDPTLSGLTNNINSQIGVLTTTQTSFGFTIDHSFNDRHTIRYSEWRDLHNSPAIDNNAYFSNELSGLKTEPRIGSGFFLTYTGSITPKLVITAGFGWMGEINNEFNAHQGVNFAGVADGTTLPTITFGGSASDAPTGWGAGSAGEISSINRKLGLAFSNNYLYTKGRNTFNFGFETRRAYQDDHECDYCTGGFAFSSLTTSNGNTGLTGANESSTGNAFASFLLGQVDSAKRQQAFETKLRNFAISPYIMDDIKITPHLTVNAGLRYDILVPFTVDNPGNVAFLDVNKPNPGAVGPNGPLLGAATSLGHGPEAAGFNRADISWKNVGPRLGFAYAINQKTVLSGGYAITFLDGGAYEFGTSKVALDYGNVLTGLVQTTSSGTNVPAYGSWDAKVLANPVATTLTASLGNGSGELHAFQKSGIRQPYSQMFDLGIQRELPWNLFGAVTYVGNHGVHLVSALNDTNQLDPRYLALGQSLLQPWNSALGQAALKTAGLSMFNGLYAPYANFATDFPNGTIAQQALLELPQYLGTEDGNTLNNFDMNGVSIYNAVQAQLQKRFTDGLSFLLSYTYSRTMSNSDAGFSTSTPNALNKFNQRAEWAVSSADQPQVTVLSGVYELPFGAGKPYFSGGSRFIANNVVGGWQVSGTFQYEAGTPFGIGATGSPLATGGNRANVVPGAPIHLNYKNYYKQYTSKAPEPVFNVDAFTDPGRVAVGDAARNQSNLRNPFNSVENVALAKKFQFGEGVQAELRMEYFNILNRMQVCGPSDANVSDMNTADNPNGQFGYVVGPCQGNTPRQGQAYFRVSF